MHGLLSSAFTQIRRVAPSVFTCVVVLAGALAAPARARADDLDERAQDVIDALRDGDVASALKTLAPLETTERLSERPALVHVLCDRAYRLDQAYRKAPGNQRIQLSNTLLELAEATLASAPADARAQWALAHAIVLRERTGPAEGPPAWLRAADLLEQAHTASPADGEALGYAVTFLLEGAVLEPGEGRVLQKRATQVAKAARRAHPDSLTLATTIASAHTWASRVLIERNRRAAKGALQTAFDVLRKHVKKDLPAVSAAALWNDAVTLDADSGFALRERYVTVRAMALGGALVFDVPISPRWTVTDVPETEEYGAYVYVTQADAAGAVRRQLLFRRYTWGRKYTFWEPREISGDNVKKIAEGLQRVSAERVFAPGARSRSIKKTKLSKDFSGRWFSLTGTASSEEGNPLTLVGYCVRGGHQESFGFLIYIYEADGEVGPEMEAVLASLREFEE